MEMDHGKKYIFGSNEKTLPNTVFENELYFYEDEILFYYTPRHSIDSASCLDNKDNILFVGDNVEAPITCIDLLFRH